MRIAFAGIESIEDLYFSDRVRKRRGRGVAENVAIGAAGDVEFASVAFFCVWPPLFAGKERSQVPDELLRWVSF
jgi:hypothetical protein